MSKQKIEMSIEVNGQDVVAYPFVESEHVTFENGMTIEEMIAQDVTTPTVTHEGVSFKVGVGDSDVSSSIVDSSVSKMTIKGQTYQNILPEPSLRNSMTNGKSMQKFNVGYDSVNVVDGVSKSAILSGSTKYHDKITGEIFDVFQENNENLELISSKMPVLSSIGKNLFDGVLEVGAINSTTGVPYNSTTAIRTKNFIRVCPNTQYVISVDNGYQKNAYAYDKNMNFISSLGNVSTFTTPSNCYYLKWRTSESLTQNDLNAKFQLEENTSATTYEPHKSNILSLSQEVVLRSLPNGVCDTYNVATKEYVQRIGEVVVKSSDKWELVEQLDSTISFYCYHNNTIFNGIKMESVCISDKFNYLVTYKEDKPLIFNGTGAFVMRVSKSGLSSYDKAGFNTWLQSNPVTVQYPLTTPVIKTVDLSSFGNWEKVVLDSSKELTLVGATPNGKGVRFGFVLSKEALRHNGIFSTFPYNGTGADATTNDRGVYIHSGKLSLNIIVDNTELGESSINGFKQYLSQNPITVWYQTTTSQSNSIKEMLSFSNGHIQLSSGAENSLIPSIDYEVPTSNSYHLDLAKVSTKYTMKNMSGTFTIDGTQYNASANGTFTTPSTLTNKLMITSAIQTNPMILEGDVTNKTLSYFNGIKSAFEDKDKIEVLSIGKNLFDGKFEMGVISANGSLGDSQYAVRTVNYIKVKPNTHYRVKINEYVDGGLIYIHEYDRNKNVVKEISTTLGFVSSNETHYVKINTHNREDRALTVDSTMQFEETTSISPYESHKSNDVKIPLLFPSRSILGGVYDEIILDRENNKAKIIQRVGKITLNGGQEYIYESVYQRFYTPLNTLKKQKYYISSLLSDKGEIINHYTGLLDDYIGAIGITGYPDSANNYPNSNWLYFKVKNITTISELKQYLSLNPITVYYELATPIITEVDIEGYPYIFKDGHIFLNGEIAPKTEIKYSINQTHVIESQNQDVLRHEKEIDYLYKLVGEYVRADYTSTLMTLNLELK